MRFGVTFVILFSGLTISTNLWMYEEIERRVGTDWEAMRRIDDLDGGQSRAVYNRYQLFFEMRYRIAQNAAITIPSTMRGTAHGAMVSRYFKPPLFGIAGVQSLHFDEKEFPPELSVAFDQGDTAKVLSLLKPAGVWQGRSRPTGSQPRYEWHLLQYYSKSRDYVLVAASDHSSDDFIFYIIDELLL